MVEVFGAIVGFIVSLLIGAFGIYVGARVVTGTDDFGYALITAIVGSVVWWLVALLVGWIPLIGGILAFVAWLYIVNVRYPGGWGKAAAIALVAWLAVVVVLLALTIVGVVEPGAVGVPAI